MEGTDQVSAGRTPQPLSPGVPAGLCWRAAKHPVTVGVLVVQRTTAALKSPSPRRRRGSRIASSHQATFLEAEVAVVTDARTASSRLGRAPAPMTGAVGSAASSSAGQLLKLAA
jgi:hypothetical protein